MSICQSTVLMALGLLLAPAFALGQDAPRFFEENCAMCHAIGGPPQDTAPDLKGVTTRQDRAWLRQFVLDPEGVAKRDAAAAALVKQYDGVVMPQIDGLSPALVDSLLDYIDERSRGAAPAAPVSSASSEGPAMPSEADVVTGRRLFYGEQRLAGRGPACVSCHDLQQASGIGGGTLGPSLTAVGARLGGLRGLTAWLGAPPTRVMRGVFRTAALETSEAKALAAFLADADSRPSGDLSPSHGRATVLAGSVAGGLLLFGMIAVAGRHRVRSVRASLPVQPAGDSL